MKKKKAFALVSVGLGHIDFGGMGYLKLVKEIRGKGTDITWLTYGRMMARKLKELNEPYRMVMSLQSLWTPGANHIFASKTGPNKDLLMHMKHFELFLKFEKPDFLLIDRVLPFAVIIAEHLGIKHYVVGSPGGEWKIENYTLSPGETKIKNGLLDTLSKRLNYEIHGISAYAKSSMKNICFMPREYYSQDLIDKTSVFVDLFDQATKRHVVPDQVGVSFGNTEYSGYLLELIPQIIDYYGKNNISIYCPKHHKSHDALSKMGINYKHWVPFDEELPKLGLLFYFGGISTTWYCINYQVPMAAASSHLDDQDYNAKRISEMGIGVSLNKDKPIYINLDQMQINDCVEQIFKIKNPKNFTSNLSSLSAELALS